MDLLETYVKEIEADLKVDEFSIKEVALKLPAKKHHWVSRLIHHKRNLIKLQRKKDDLLRKLAADVRGVSPVRLSSMATDKAISETDIIRELNNQLQDEQLIIDLLEKTEKVFSSMSFDVSNIVKIMSLETI